MSESAKEIGLNRQDIHETNYAGTDYFCGDIHGCYDELMDAMAAVNFNKKEDRLFCVGDLVDRGPKNMECLRLVYEPWFNAVRGNHEVMMADALNGGDQSLWFYNGGAWAAHEDMRRLRLLANDAMLLMPIAMEVEFGDKRIGVVHADVTSGEWGGFNERRDVWSRDRISSPKYIGIGDTNVNGIDAVVVGHTILERPVVRGNVVHIDTGSFHTGRITILSASQVLGAANA